MNDKEIIIETLNKLKHVEGYLKIKEYWNTLNLNNETQERIKIKLEDNNLASRHIYNQWELGITDVGFRVKPNDLNDEGNLKKKRINKEFRRGVTTTLIGVLVGFVLTFGKELTTAKWLTAPKETIVLPKIQLVHDTVPIQQIKNEKKNVVLKKQ